MDLHVGVRDTVLLHLTRNEGNCVKSGLGFHQISEAHVKVFLRNINPDYVFWPSSLLNRPVMTISQVCNPARSKDSFIKVCSWFWCYTASVAVMRCKGRGPKFLPSSMACMPACPLIAHAQWPEAATLLLQPVAEVDSSYQPAGVLIGGGFHTVVPLSMALLSQY